MNLVMNLRVLAAMLLILSVAQLPPWLLSLVQGEPQHPFLVSVLCHGGVGLLGLWFTRNAPRVLTPRDGFLIVSVGWLVASAMGAIPYVTAQRLGWVDAIFEVASGYTTTGSSVLTDIEVWPQGLLLWRSLTQWLGGMGMLLLAIAVLPFLGVGGVQILRAEVPGPSKERLTPRLVSTARLLWVLYLGLTLLAMGGYLLAGMGVLDAANHAMTTLSTGGFSTRNASMAAFTPAAQWVAILFMVLGGTNFVIHHRLVVLRDISVLRHVEFLWYLAILLGVGALAALSIWDGSWEGVEKAVRNGLFQTVSLMTTTGYATDDYTLWHPLIQLMLAGVMVVGGMAGSTSGGGKVIRLIILMKTMGVAMKRMLNPHRILHLRVGGESVPQEMVETCIALLLLAGGLLSGSAILLHFMGVDLISAFSASLTCLSNVGPGWGIVGPVSNFSTIPDGGKIVLSLLMITGRLEIFTVVMLFLSFFWRR